MTRSYSQKKRGGVRSILSLCIVLSCIPISLVQAKNQLDGAAHNLLPNLPPVWLIMPFVTLLLMIATGPLFYPRFWHRYYPFIAVGLATVVTSYYVLILNDIHSPIHALAEYVQFIALIGSLYVAAGGVLIHLNMRPTPKNNVLLLLTGAVVANLIGTTGASMLLIRPYMRLNKGRIQVYHIIFFIFMVSNIGGALTPIGDPPLFLGFLNGIPFVWTLLHNSSPWCFAITALAIIFYYRDRKNTASVSIDIDHCSAPIQLRGKRNLLWLAVIIGAVFLDPQIFTWVPAIHCYGSTYSYVRELIMLGMAGLAYRSTPSKLLVKNQFSFEPLREVLLIFIGIFGTMLPALALIGEFAQSPVGRTLINPHTLYWATGSLSSVLDNAPTYLNFLAASMAAHGSDLHNAAAVKAFATGDSVATTVTELRAISIAAVFFGAMTYIGNGPNFMVRAIAEAQGISMPSFMGYLTRYAMRILLPVLISVWVIFFYLPVWLSQ